MHFIIDNQIHDLLSSQKYWFKDFPNAKHALSTKIIGNDEGVYCLWWRNIDSFPKEMIFNLAAGKRGIIPTQLKLEPLISIKHIALYVGKGKITGRISSHIKEPKSSTRTPFTWLRTIFPEGNTYSLINDHVGFSYIKDKNKLNQVYLENLAIGILRPWFNLRLTA